MQSKCREVSPYPFSQTGYVRASLMQIDSKDVEKSLHRALTLHAQGNLGQAEQLYRIILTQCPDHFDALHKLGVLKCQQSHNEEGTRLIAAALLLKPSSADALFNFALGLKNL